MWRFALVVPLIAILTLRALAAPAQALSAVDFDALGPIVAGTGFKAEAGQGVYKVTLPGEDGWFVEVWLSKTAPRVLITFPCQALPDEAIENAALLKLLAQNGRLDGAYFGFNEKTRNFYLESTLPTDGLTAPLLKAECERLQALAIKTADLWDTSKWPRPKAKAKAKAKAKEKK